jgi:hypothetical protein
MHLSKLYLKSNYSIRSGKFSDGRIRKFKIYSGLLMVVSLFIILSACVFTPTKSDSNSENVKNEVSENQILMHPEIAVNDSTMSIEGTFSPIEAAKIIALFKSEGVINE